MRRLVSTSEASEILGISLQGIHYRIKKNQLQSTKKDGKIFVYVDDSMISTNNSKLHKNDFFSSFDKLIEAKDEQIQILKKSIKYIRNQYIDEINRLEKNQKRIVEVFNSEIKLLQSAFNEMKAIYKPKLENVSKEKQDFISIKEFFILMKRASKNNTQIKNIILNAIQKGDKRFIYNKIEKKILILNEDFTDLI